MSPITIVGFACLLLIVATGSQAVTIDAVHQQCIKKESSPGVKYFGACIDRARNSDSIEHICAGLRCAYESAGNGIYKARYVGRPLDGTKCGVYKVCDNGKCKTVNPAEVPTYNGIDATYKCIE